MNVLEIKNLTKTFSGFKLDNLSLTLPSGCIMGLIGENGAGKSTTIKLILDILHKDSGTITVLGKDNTDNIRLTKEDVGVVMDEVGIPECLTPKQVGRIMQDTFRNWNAEEYNRLLQKLSLPENQPFKNFSRGMKMKLGICILGKTRNVTARCLRQRAVSRTMELRTERKEVIADVERKHQSTQKIKRTFPGRTGCQTECGAANDLKVGARIVSA